MTPEERMAWALLAIVVTLGPILWISVRSLAWEWRFNKIARRLRDDIDDLTAEERSKVLDAYIDAVVRGMR